MILVLVAVVLVLDVVGMCSRDTWSDSDCGRRRVRLGKVKVRDLMEEITSHD